MSSVGDNPKSLAAWIAALLAVTVVVLWAAYLVRGVLLLIYVSGLLAVSLSPAVAWIERTPLPRTEHRAPRWLAILLIYLIAIAALAATIVAVLPSVRDQAQQLWTALPGMLERAQQYLMSAGLILQPLTVKEVFQRAPIDGGDAVGTVMGAAWNIVGGVFGVVTILILTFYLLLESSAIFQTFIGLFPRSRRSEIRHAATEITGKLSAWLGGQLMLMAIIGATAAIGLGLLGVPYFYVLALIAAVGELVPVVGPIFAAIPAIGIALNESVGLALSVAVFFLIQQQIENHLLVPKLMERQVGVSAVTVIIALLIGGALMGLTGAILAIPTAAILQVIYQRSRADRDQSAPP